MKPSSLICLAIALALLAVSPGCQDQGGDPVGDDRVISVNPDEVHVVGNEWPADVTVDITIGNDTFYPRTDAEGRFFLNLLGTGYVIDRGALVSAAHGEITKNHTVTSLAFSEEMVYPDETSAVGTASPNSVVFLQLVAWTAFLGPEFFAEVEVTTDGEGDWEYDFADELDARYQAVDEGYVPGNPSFGWTEVRASQFDEEGDRTYLRRSQDKSETGLTIFPATNTVHGQDWPYGELTVVVDDGQQTHTYEHGLHPGGDFHFDHDTLQLEIGPGFTVSAQIGDLVLEHQVIDLAISEIDTESDIVRGVGRANLEQSGPDVRVTIQPEGRPGRIAMASPTGEWAVDFSTAGDGGPGGPGFVAPHDLTEETRIQVTQWVALDSGTVATSIGD